MVCDNQNSLERATVELKKVNISIIKYPLFSVSLRTLLDKIKAINLFCSVWFFLSCQTLSLLYKRFLPVRHSSQTAYIYIFFFISQQLPPFLPTGKQHRFINWPGIKYIVRVEKILGIAGFKSVPIVYYSLIGKDFHDHKRYFQHVFLSGFENESRNRLVVWSDASYN